MGDDAPPVPPADLDFWAMVRMAREMVPEKSPGADVEANQLIISLDRAARLVSMDVEEVIHRPRGHSWAIFRYLFALWVYGEMPSNQLATVTGMRRSQISNLTKQLEKEGLVTRRKSRNDGRAVVISLSEKGSEYISQAFHDHNAVESEWAGGLTEIERDLLIALLDKLMQSPRAKEVRAQIIDR
ncbi:MarR family winged helix-turn-helix transcriptional regulator [Corynebacterium sp. YIM 101645]|uniref:MarR family winged helix-turn-helix transcriptional regulator n=1 Tax=Corynebacterium lemuris TaxID=1859292 RepID=A0ABT2FVP6_9CORY|nr:MarR family winged helix-turn-helix transcriptional regulator [Corynebacterium lemuris]MCS5478039.1 MarR family winged helix-turn-helix transcriptional regulator [Corynebacterium lemuris]